MALRLGALGLISAIVLLGQDPGMERISLASARLRDAGARMSQDWEVPRKPLTDFHLALRDWIESRLPKTKAELDARFPLLYPSLITDLARAGLFRAHDTKYGVVSSLSLSRPPEYPGALLVIAGAALPCGTDQSVFLYDWNDGNPVRRLESIPDAPEFGQPAAARFSDPDGQGSRLAVLTRFAVTCVSCWNGIGYTLFRLGPGTAPATILQSGDRGIYYCHDWNIRLKPDDFLLELPGRSIDVGILIRTHVLHYRVGKDGAVRTDPVALQPQDFVDEWLTRPWDEMASRSSASNLEQLEKWHGVLHSDIVLGEFQFVQPCTEKPGQWQIAVDLDWVAGKELPEPLPVYFLIRRKENYRFQMTGISFDREDGCPGESSPSEEKPTLFGSEPGHP